MKISVWLILLILLSGIVFAQTPPVTPAPDTQKYMDLLKANPKVSVAYIDRDNTPQNKTGTLQLDPQNMDADWILVSGLGSMEVSRKNADYFKRRILITYLDHPLEIIFSDVAVSPASITAEVKKDFDYCLGAHLKPAPLVTAQTDNQGVQIVRLGQCGLEFGHDERNTGINHPNVTYLKLSKNFIRDALKTEFAKFESARGNFTTEQIHNQAEQLYGQISIQYNGRGNQGETYKHYPLINPERKFDEQKGMWTFVPDYYTVKMIDSSQKSETLEFNKDSEKENNMIISFNGKSFTFKVEDSPNGRRYILYLDGTVCFEKNDVKQTGWLKELFPEDTCPFDVKVDNIDWRPTKTDTAVIGIRIDRETYLNAAAQKLAGRNLEKYAQYVGSLRQLNQNVNYIDLFDPVFFGSKLTKLYTGDPIILENQGEGYPKDRYFLITANKRIIYAIFGYKEEKRLINSWGWTDYLERDTTELGVKKSRPNVPRFIDEPSLLNGTAAFMDYFKDGMDDVSSQKQELGADQIDSVGVGFTDTGQRVQLNEVSGLDIDWGTSPGRALAYELAAVPPASVAAEKTLKTAAPVFAQIASGIKDYTIDLRVTRDLKQLQQWKSELAAIEQYPHFTYSLPPEVEAAIAQVDDAERSANVFREAQRLSPDRLAKAVTRAEKMDAAYQSMQKLDSTAKTIVDLVSDSKKLEEITKDASALAELKKVYAASPSVQKAIAGLEGGEEIAKALSATEEVVKTAKVASTATKALKAAEEVKQVSKWASRAAQYKKIQSVGRGISSIPGGIANAARFTASAVKNTPASIAKAGKAIWSGVKSLKNLKSFLVPAGPIGWGAFVVFTAIDVGMVVYEYAATHTYAFDSDQLIINWDRELWQSKDLQINFLMTNLNESTYADLSANVPSFVVLAFDPQTTGIINSRLSPACNVDTFVQCLKDGKYLTVRKIIEGDETNYKTADTEYPYTIESLVNVKEEPVHQVLILDDVKDGEEYEIAINSSPNIKMIVKVGESNAKSYTIIPE